MGRINKQIKEFTPEDEVLFNAKINEDFSYFAKAFPDIELGDTEGGSLVKLRVQSRDMPLGGEDFSLGDIFFELQWMLYIKKHKQPGIKKVIVSDLSLTSIIPNTAFRRGLMIKVKFV